jgi:acetyl esterase/lipase
VRSTTQRISGVTTCSRLLAGGKVFGRGPIWLDVSDSDPFLDATRALAGVLRDNGKKVELHVSPGGHDRGYWRRHTADYLRFYVSAFARC